MLSITQPSPKVILNIALRLSKLLGCEQVIIYIVMMKGNLSLQVRMPWIKLILKLTQSQLFMRQLLVALYVQELLVRFEYLLFIWPSPLDYLVHFVRLNLLMIWKFLSSSTRFLGWETKCGDIFIKHLFLKSRLVALLLIKLRSALVWGITLLIRRLIYLLWIWRWKSRHYIVLLPFSHVLKVMLVIIYTIVTSSPASSTETLSP